MKPRNNKNILGEDFRNAAITRACYMNDGHVSPYGCQFLMAAGALIGQDFNEKTLEKALELVNPMYKSRIRNEINDTISRLKPR